MIRMPRPSALAKSPVWMSPVLRLLAINLLFGLALGIIFTSVIVLSNTANLNYLIVGDSQSYLVLLMLYIMCSLTFGSVAMAAAVLSLPWSVPKLDTDRSANECGTLTPPKV